jgi:hypothetical protein
LSALLPLLLLVQVGDFGLSLKMDHTDTHISSVYQGTLTHMAPGEGQCGPARFYVTLW